MIRLVSRVTLLALAVMCGGCTKYAEYVIMTRIVAVADSGQEDSWKSWQPGLRRNAGVRADTQRVITQFLDVARTRGNCACRKYFLEN
jgi:hypothetical protein